MKAFKTYNGGKAANGTFQKIINHIPKCDLYVEPFLGNGSIFHNLKLPALSVVNDIDTAVIDAFVFASAANESIIVKNTCYQNIIEAYDSAKNAVFYFDPPYRFETRLSQQKYYKHDWTDREHDIFLQRIQSMESNVILSHYPCSFYDKGLKDWRTFDFESMTRNGLRTERIYMNFAKPEILQDYKFLGENFTDRQRIKRKIKRHIARLEELQEDERTGILSALFEKFNTESLHLIL